MNNNRKSEPKQSLFSVPSPIEQREIIEITNTNGKSNLTPSEEEKDRQEALVLKKEIIQLSRQFLATLGEKLKYYRDRKLYRFEADTFGQWCEQELGMKRHYAYRLISAFEVYQNVAHGQQNRPEIKLPINERQVRPLTKLPKEQQVEVWLQAIQSSDKMPTGKQVEQLVQERKRRERAARYNPQIERFKVGNVVRVTAKYNTKLKGYHSCWAQIVSLEEHSYTILTWKGAVSEVAHDDLMLMSRVERDTARTLLSQLNQIYSSKSQYPDCVAFLHYLGTKPDPRSLSVLRILAGQ